MVVVHRAREFRFVIYTLDHQPAHVHVVGSGQAKINLLGADGLPELVYSIGIGRAEMRKLMQEIEGRQDAFVSDWERIHGPVGLRI